MREEVVDLRSWSEESRSLSEVKIELVGHTRGVSGLVFSPDERWMASCGFDARVRLWNLSAPIRRERLKFPMGGAEMCERDRGLALRVPSSRVEIWDLE